MHSPRAEALLINRPWAKGLMMESKVKIPVESKSGRLTARSSTVFPEFASYDCNRTKNTDSLLYI